MSTSLPSKEEIYDKKSRDVILHSLTVAGVTLLGFSAAFAWDYTIIPSSDIVNSMYLQAFMILLISILLMYSVKSNR